MSRGDSLTQAPGNLRIARALGDPLKVALLKTVWLEGNWSAQINWQNVTKNSKKGKKNSRVESIHQIKSREFVPLKEFDSHFKKNLTVI